MKEVINKPLDELKIKIKNIDDLQKVNKLSLKNGMTKVTIDIVADKKIMSFKLNENRKIDHKILNLLKNNDNIEII